MRAAGVDAFGVNLFVPGDPTADRPGLAAYLARLEPEAAALGVTLGEATWDDDDYPGKVEAAAGRAAGGGQLHLRHPRRSTSSAPCRRRAPPSFSR